MKIKLNEAVQVAETGKGPVNYGKGDIITLPDIIAETLIEDGAAEEVKEPTKAKQVVTKKSSKRKAKK